MAPGKRYLNMIERIFSSRMKWIYLLSGLLLLTGSCQMQKLTVQVYEAPKIELPPDVRAILVTSRFVPATGDYEAVQWGYFESVDTSLWDLSKYYAESYSEILASSGRYISKPDFNINMLRNNNDTLPELLPWSGLQNIAKETRATGLAILQGFSISEDGIDVSEKQEAEETIYNADARITVKAAWRLIQPERRRILDENVYAFTREFSSEGKSGEEAASGLPSRDEMLKEACHWAAEQYAGMIIPGTETVHREYYKEGSERMDQAHEAMLKGEWSKAEVKWKWLAYNAENDEIKARASYNMALICERDGRLNQALGYARRANNLYPHRRHLDLINELMIKEFREQEKREKGEVIRNW